MGQIGGIDQLLPHLLPFFIMPDTYSSLPMIKGIWNLDEIRHILRIVFAGFRHIIAETVHDLVAHFVIFRVTHLF